MGNARQVSAATVDEGIHAMAQHKLRLDEAVLGPRAATRAGGGDRGGAAETGAMGELLAALVTPPAVQDATAAEGPVKPEAGAAGSRPHQRSTPKVIELE